MSERATVRRLSIGRSHFWESHCNCDGPMSQCLSATWREAMDFTEMHAAMQHYSRPSFAELVAERERPRIERAEELTKAWGTAWREALRLSGQAVTLSTDLPASTGPRAAARGGLSNLEKEVSPLHELTIGHLTFAVREDDEAIRAHNSRHQCSIHGFTNMSSQEIVLATEDHEGHKIGDGQRRTTLLHEVLHAALEVSGLERNSEEEERWINALQGPLLTALQDEWLLEELGDFEPEEEGDVKADTRDWKGKEVGYMGKGGVDWRDPAPRSISIGRRLVDKLSDDMAWVTPQPKTLTAKTLQDAANEALAAYDRRRYYYGCEGGDGRHDATGGSSCPN